MALGHSPSIVRDGLVFYYDMGNTQKSWKGAPTTNLYADGDYSLKSLHPVRDGPWTFPAGEKDPNGNQAIKVTADGTTSYHGRDIAVTIGQTYSSSCWIYVSLDCNSTLVRLTGEQGFPYNAAYNLSNKGTWQYVKVSGNATTTNARILAYQVSNMTTGYVLFGSIQFENTGFATPFVNGARSNTQSILDLTGSNTVTANSLTYASDGSFSFNGSNYIDSSISSTNVFNLNVWLYNDYVIPGNDSSIGGVLSSYQSVINFNRQTTQGVNLGGWTGSATNESVHIWSNASTSSGFNGMTYIRDAVPIGWHNFQFNWNGSTYDIWIDGIKKTTYAHSSVGHAKLIPINAVRIGGDVAQNYYFIGKISAVTISNTIKSDNEVKQNFEALRDRYGI